MRKIATFAQIWDTATWRPLATLGGFRKGAHALAYSPDGKRLAITSGDIEAVKLWDTESWQDLFTLDAPCTGLGGAGFSPEAVPSLGQI
jgi:WD40 repeat protein